MTTRLLRTCALLNAALEGKLENVEFHTGPVFGLSIPESCPGVPEEVLVPKNTWKDKAAYDIKARELAESFKKNFKEYEKFVTEDIKQAGPTI